MKCLKRKRIKILVCFLYIGMILCRKDMLQAKAETVENEKILEIDQPVEAALESYREESRFARYKFVPEQTKEYIFYAKADYSNTITLYNSGGRIGDAASGVDKECTLYYQLEEGVTYYVEVQFLAATSTTGTIQLGVKLAPTVEDFESSQEILENTNIDGIAKSITQEEKSVRVCFQPKESGYYSVFSKDYCGNPDGCRQECICEECIAQGECQCLNDLKVEIYMQGEEGLELYHYGKADMQNGFLVYTEFDKDTTYYIEISSADGMKNGSFLLCIGTDLKQADVTKIDITQITEGVLRDKTQDLFYQIQPEEDGTYQWKSYNAYYVYMTLYDSDMKVVKKTSEGESNFDVKVEMKQGSTYYVKLSTQLKQVGKFTFQAELVKEEEGKEQDPTKPDESTKPSTDVSDTNKNTQNTQTQKPVNQNNSKVSIGKVTLKTIATKNYTGKKIKPSVTLKYNGKTLAKGKDYTVTYSNNKKIGTAKVTITGIGNYTGKRTATFKIIPAQAKIKKGKRSGKKLTLKWGKVKGVTGYEIKYSNSSKFKKAKTKNVKGCKVTLKLKNKKKWYVKIRAYKKVGKKKIYGKYSKVKKY